MADTIISNTPARDDGSTALGWIVALIVVLAVIVAGFVWAQRDAGIPNTGTDVNVELPTTGSADTSGTMQGTVQN
jgi:hypothetical protein